MSCSDDRKINGVDEVSFFTKENEAEEFEEFNECIEKGKFILPRATALNLGFAILQEIGDLDNN